MDPTRIRHALALLLTLGALAAPAVTPAAAQDLVEPKRLDRRFPQFQFCPITLDLDFVADGAEATLHFKANVYGQSPGSPDLVFIGHAIDGIAVSTTADHDANFGFPPSGSPSENCYLGAPAGSFWFNRPGLALPLLELFDTDPAARGWDLAHGAWFDPARSSPRDPENDTGLTGGCLALGVESPGGALSDSASTSVKVTGLTAGAAYTLSGWWYVRDNPVDGAGNGLASLTVWVTGSGATPIARRTWGAVKGAYRR